MLLNEIKKSLIHVRIILTCCIAATAKYGFQHQMVKKDGEKEKKISWNYSYTLKTKWMSFILAPLYPVAIYDHWAHATFELHRTPLAPTFTNLYFMILLSIYLHLFIFCIIIYEVDIYSLLDLAHGVWYLWEI